MCNLIQKWWHKRWRDYDTVTMYPSLVLKARTKEDLERVWEIFKLMPGQEHWHCECSEREK